VPIASYILAELLVVAILGAMMYQRWRDVALGRPFTEE
jgi:hypothetical protein